MKVFLSYGAPQDQVTALRIQALAVVAAKDLSVYVPPVRDVDAWTEVRGKLGASDVLIAITLGELNGWAQTQIKYAVEVGIPVFILGRLPSTTACHYQMHPADPAAVPSRLERLVAQTDHCVAKEIRGRLVGLCVLAAGLLLLDGGGGSQHAG